MQRRYILLALLLVALLIVPAMGAATAQGVFTRDEGTKTNETGVTHTSAFNTYLQGIYFRSARSVPNLGAVKLYMEQSWHPSYFKNATSNSSHVSATLKAGNTVVSTGELVWDRNGITNDLYLAYFPATWDPSTIEDRALLNLTWNKASFDILFGQGDVSSISTIDNNLLFAGFAMAGGAVGATRIPASSTTGLVGYNHQTDYYDIWALQYSTGQNENGLTSYLDLTRYINGYYYNSRVQVNETYPSGGTNYTIFDQWGSTDHHILSVNNERIIYIDAWDPQLRHYGAAFNLSKTYEPPEEPGIGDLYIYTYDGSKGSLMDGVLVTYVDVDDSAWTGWAYSGALGHAGRVDFQAFVGREYNISAAATGYDTAYVNYTVSSFPAIVKMYLFPNLGYSTLEFYVVNNATSNPVTGVPVNILDHDTSEHNGKLTISGFARFNTTSGHIYDWDIARGMCDCSVTSTPDSCYLPVSGNTTATAGPLRLTVYLNTCTELGQGTGAGDGDTITDPHAAAESVMEMIYSMLPAFLMIVFLMLFVGAMDRRRR